MSAVGVEQVHRATFPSRAAVALPNSSAMMAFARHAPWRAPARARVKRRSRSRRRAGRRGSDATASCDVEMTEAARSAQGVTLRRPSLRTGGSEALVQQWTLQLALGGVSVVWRLPWPMEIGERSKGGGRSLHLLPGVVARAYQRAGFYMTIAHLEAVATERRELVGRVVPRDREIAGSRRRY